MLHVHHLPLAMRIGIFDSSTPRRNANKATLEDLAALRKDFDLSVEAFPADTIDRSKYDELFRSDKPFFAMFLHENDNDLAKWSDIGPRECFRNTTIIRYTKGLSFPTNVRNEYYFIQRSIPESGLTIIECKRLLEWLVIPRKTNRSQRICIQPHPSSLSTRC